jgi:RNA polymerase subunit RPABC4/transcription elongation factor Spt4
MKRNLFKYLFWFLIVLIFAFAGLMLLRVGFEISQGTRITPNLVLLALIPIAGVAALISWIAVFVYNDAPKRGMDRWMWMTIAVFVPNLIGLIIYFIVRSNYNAKCLNCGKNIKSEFSVCPYCSTPLNSSCPRCGRQVLNDWQTCPYCRQDLSQKTE